jgi:sugar fermentation stimulation protein A
MKAVLVLPDLIEAKIVNRPSKTNKSPYLADIKVNNKVVMAHSPALGLSGLIYPGATVKVRSVDCENTKRCSKYTIEKVLVREKEIKTKKTWVGANPVRANLIFRNTMDKKLFTPLKDVTITNQEYSILDSRLDFKGIDKKNNEVYIEVKNVPLTDFHVSTMPQNRKVFYSTINKKKYKRVAVFPDGQVKPGNDLVSPRAYKHLLTLEKLSKKKNTRAILIFVIQRSDCQNFIPNYVKDPKYSNKLYKLHQDSNVEIYVLSYKWRGDRLYYDRQLKILDKTDYYFYGKYKKNKSKSLKI